MYIKAIFLRIKILPDFLWRFRRTGKDIRRGTGKKRGPGSMNDMVAKQAGRMKRGDEEAFDWLYSEYVGKLYRMAFFITGNQADSEDVVQETFVKCYLRKDSIRDEQAFEAWLYQILVRTAWKNQKRKKSDFSLDEITEGEDADSAMGQWIQTDRKAAQPLEQVLKEEEYQRIGQAIRKLEWRQRTVVMLYYFNDMSVEEIARVTRSFAGTVKSRLFKARKNLRKMLDEGRGTPG